MVCVSVDCVVLVLGGCACCGPAYDGGLVGVGVL